MSLEKAPEPQVEPNSVEVLANSATTSSSPLCEMSNREDFLEKAFRIPTVSMKPSKRAKSQRPRPPAVATSDEFREWFREMEQNKENEEQKRQEKKAEREKKLSQKKKQQFVKAKSKTKASKPRL